MFMSAAMELYTASSPSSRRWKKAGTWGMRISTTANARKACGLNVWRVITVVDMAPTYIAVRSDCGRAASPVGAARGGGCRDGACAGSLETDRAHRDRLSHLRGGGARRPAARLVAHLRPNVGRRGAEGSRPQPGHPAVPQPADHCLAGGAAGAAAVLAGLLHLGRLHAGRLRAGSRLGVAGQGDGPLARRGRRAGALVGAARGAPPPRGATRRRRPGGRVAPGPPTP